MKKNNYYLGFMNACKAYGLNKQAAAALYKQAIPSTPVPPTPGRIKSFFSAMGRPFSSAATAYKAQRNMNAARRTADLTPAVPRLFSSEMIDPVANATARSHILEQAGQILPEALYQSYAGGNPAGQAGRISRFFGGIGGGLANMRDAPYDFPHTLGFNKLLAFGGGFARGLGRAPRFSTGEAYDAIRALTNRRLELGLRTGDTKSLRKIIKSLHLEGLTPAEIDQRIARMYEEFNDRGGVIDSLTRSPLDMLRNPNPAPPNPRLRLNAADVGSANEFARRESERNKWMSRRGGWLSVFQPIANFGIKHPIITTLGLAGLGGFLANKFSTTPSSEPYSSIDTLTPSQKRMLQDAESGYGLPGLGGANW